MIQPNHSDNSDIIVVGYVRRSSEMQKDNFSLDAQKRGIRDAAKLRSLPEPFFFEDDERSARGEQIAKRPGFKALLDFVQAHPGKVIVFVHSFDRWSRNVMVTLQSFRMLSQTRTAGIPAKARANERHKGCITGMCPLATCGQGRNRHRSLTPKNSQACG